MKHIITKIDLGTWIHKTPGVGVDLIVSTKSPKFNFLVLHSPGVTTEITNVVLMSDEKERFYDLGRDILKRVMDDNV